ncbi:MAG TPA: CUAEP/CCAEP-tail radical SAM protein, partial [Candidatus Polarisedimenticolia bacterium]|nr:CUAEP/CCAEP-tail radical SAM protein [Candidatus Polarisedimenticolia bacterium]
MASLKESGAILLVSCYEQGHQPLSIASPLAVLRAAGFSPAVLDLSQQALDLEAVRRARLVAVAVPMHTALRLGVRAAERVRSAHPEAAVVFYGLYAALNAATLLGETVGALAVVGGEYEEPLLNLARALEGAGDLASALRAAGPIAGVRTAWHDAAPFIGKAPSAIPDRSALPPLTGYVQVEENGARRAAGQVEATRGCLHRCRHCPIPPVYGGRFFVVPRQVVLEDIRRQVEAGATHITFGDPDFLNGPGHTLSLARALHAAHPAVTFDVTAKVEHLLGHRDRLAELRSLGCLFVVTAAESISDRVLAILDKGHTRADIEAVLALARGAGLALRPTWLPFTPWSDLDDYLEMLDFAASWDLVDSVDPVQWSIRLLVPPGSLLESHPDFLPARGPLDARRFTWTWNHPDPRVDELQRAVAAIAEAAALKGDDPRATF